MRKIKFRAWQKVTGVMFYNIEKGTGEPDGNPPFADYLENANMVIMQFTGFVDKNGKDIYEDDTVIWKGWEYNVVFSSQDGCWILKDDREGWACPSLCEINSPQQPIIEVIGNVYEGKKQVKKPFESPFEIPSTGWCKSTLITWTEMET